MSLPADRQGHPAVNSSSRVSKRQMVRDAFVRDHAQLILKFDKLQEIIPDPFLASSKRVWERQMYHARTVARTIAECDETGTRASLHNYILSNYEKLISDNVEYRIMLPDPAEECTDLKWIDEVLNILIVFQAVD